MRVFVSTVSEIKVYIYIYIYWVGLHRVPLCLTHLLIAFIHVECTVPMQGKIIVIYSDPPL